MTISYVIPPNYDFLAATIIEGLIENGHVVYTSENANYGNYINRNSFINFANTSDLLLIHSGTYCDYSILKKIVHKNVTYIDGSDNPWLDKILDFPINLIFKRELLKNVKTKIYPLPFSVEKRYVTEFNLPKTKITYISTLNNYYRRSLQEFLINMNIDNDILYIGNTGERSYSGISGLPSPTPKYYKLLAESIASINYPGKGWDCARFWEIIASKSCLISPEIDINIPNPFIENIHYLKFTTLEELGFQIKFCLDNPNKALEIANNAYLHMLRYHTSKQRAKYLVDTIKDNYVNNVYINFENTIKIKNKYYYLIKQYTYFIWKSYFEKFIKSLIKDITND